MNIAKNGFIKMPIKNQPHVLRPLFSAIGTGSQRRKIVKAKPNNIESMVIMGEPEFSKT
jgi:hypothetical protein